MSVDRPYSKLDKLSNVKIFVATPLAKNGRLHIETADYCSVVAKRNDVDWGHVCIMGPELARNILIEDHSYFRTDWTHIMFIDSDVVPPPYSFQRLIDLDADFVVPLVPIYLKEGVYWQVTDENDNMIPMHEELPDEPFETQSAGAGCILVRKEVLEEMEWPYFKMEYQPKWANKNEPVKRGEDIYFSQKVKALGYKLMVDPGIECKHYHDVDLLKAYKDIKKQVTTGRVRVEKA
jgi:hypothetical protein